MDKHEAAVQILNLLKERRLTLSTAESCTGGMIGACFTSIPGSSAAVKGGVISYCDELKQALLGVSSDILETCGAVSRECALAMAAGARRACRSDIAVSVTGLAGPDSDSSGLPVGLVFIGYSSPDETIACRHFFAGSRDEIRESALCAVLQLLLSKLK